MIQVCRKEESMSERNFGQELLHTPGGVRDIYGAECASRLKIQQELHQVMISYGFRDIQTPTFEYFDIFSKEKGSVQSQAMFKFFDRGNNTLVLRPDITPAIARCVSKYDREEEMPIRLCYMGNTFVNTTPYKGKLQEVTQIGAELYNDTSSDADAEMVVLTIECLLKSGLKEFQLEIGHADLLRGLVEEAGFSEAEAAQLFELIESKNFFGVEELLDRLTASSALLCMTKDDVSAMEPSACINCGKCVEVCPGRVVPKKLAEYAEHYDEEAFVKNNGMECCECGCCSYICPAKRPLTQTIKSMRRMQLAKKKK